MKSSLALEYAFPGCNTSAELSYSALSCHRISKFSMSERKLERDISSMALFYTWGLC